MPRRLWWNLLLAGALVMLVVVFAVVAVRAANKAAQDSPGPKLSAAARRELEHADCAHLRRLETKYLPNGDSVEPDATALQLTRQRQAKLHCHASV